MIIICFIIADYILNAEKRQRVYKEPCRLLGVSRNKGKERLIEDLSYEDVAQPKYAPEIIKVVDEHDEIDMEFDTNWVEPESYVEEERYSLIQGLFDCLLPILLKCLGYDFGDRFD